MRKLRERLLLAYLDKWIAKIARCFSYLGSAAIIITAFLAFAGIVSSKLFRFSIANVNELIDYLLIAVVYCCVADIQLGGGLIQVDIFYRKFPKALKKVIKLFTSVAGMAIYAFAAYQAISLFEKHYSLKTTAAASINSFVIWPFTLLYIIGSFMLAFALLWSILREIFMPNLRDDVGAQTGEVSA
ncbi:MAG: TRAP transporter small permease [Oscillospiraceae bacterium]|jgi:TRAP-type C4-dicarboxylate transport system permease small subunit